MSKQEYMEVEGIEVHGITGQEITRGTYSVRNLTAKEKRAVPGEVAYRLDVLDGDPLKDYLLMLSDGNTYIAAVIREWELTGESAPVHPEWLKQ